MNTKSIILKPKLPMWTKNHSFIPSGLLVPTTLHGRYAVKAELSTSRSLHRCIAHALHNVGKEQRVAGGPHIGIHELSEPPLTPSAISITNRVFP